jgi:glycosyltransferase involved in cell wall biosynthesis
MTPGHNLPTISIVTPSFNQGRFLGAAIASVVGQSYPPTEYVVIDGGSSDESVDVIRSHERDLTWWTSGPDAGQYDAVNRGFARTSGDIMGWLNSDDMYLPGALQAVAEVFAEFPEVEWISSLFPVTWNAAGIALEMLATGGFNKESFRHGGNLPGGKWHARAFIQQESTFWRRSLWQRTGAALDTSFQLAADFDLWARFYETADLIGVGALLGGFRVHPDQKTATRIDAYREEAVGALERYGRRPTGGAGAFTRRLLWAMTSGRTVRGSPLRIDRLPGTFPVVNCVWREDHWALVRRAVF